MYMTGQKPRTAQTKQQSKRERTPDGTEERHSAAAGLSYEDMRIHYNSQIPLQRQAADHEQKAPLENDWRAETGTDRMTNYSSEPDLTGKMDEQRGVVQRNPVPLDTIMSLFQSGMKISAVAAAVGLPLYVVYKLIRRCMLQEKGQDAPAALRIAEEEEKSEEEAPIQEEIIEIKDKETSEEEESEGEERTSQEEALIQEEVRQEPLEEPPQKEMLEVWFATLEAQIQKIYSQEDIISKNPPLAIKLWRKLRHKRNQLTETELAELEEALPGKKALRRKVPEMPLEPEPTEEEEQEDPRDAMAEMWLGPLDQHPYGSRTFCRRGSMLVTYLIEKGIIDSENEVTIGHQSGPSKVDKKFVAIIRGKKYLIFMAQHPGEDYKEYIVSVCWITQSMGYRIDLAGKRIRIGNNGFELNNGKTLV